MNLPLPHDPADFIGTIPVSLSVIAPSPTNPRETFTEASMAEMIESVRLHGVLQPILLRPWPAEYKHPVPRPEYEIVAGERRFRAATAAGHTIIEAKVRNLTDHEVLEIQIIENLQREGLHPLEEALGYQRMMEEYGYTADSLAEKVHKSKAYIYARLKLTALAHEARKAFMSGKLNPSTALLIARIPNDKLQEKATREITDPDWKGEGMSVRAAQKHLQNNYMLRLVDATFPIDAVDLIKKAGSCEHCPKRTGNQPADLFEDVQSADVCTDPDCYHEKRQANIKRLADEAAKIGQTVVTGKDAEKIASYGDIKQNSGLVALDRRCYEDKEKRTYREIMAATPEQITLVEDTRKGTFIETVPAKQLASALKAAGITEGRGIGGNQQNADEKKAKIERTYRKRLLERTRQAILKDFAETGPALEKEELIMIARAMFWRTDWEGRRAIVRIWNTDAEKIEHGDVHAFQEQITTPGAMATGDLYLLLLDCALIGETMPNAYTYQNAPDQLLDIARNSGINPAAIKQELADEARKKASPPKKAAQAEEPIARAKKGKEDAPKPGETFGAEEELEVGDRVRIRDGLIGPAGIVRACAGKEGVVEEKPKADCDYIVRIGPEADDWEVCARADLEKLPAVAPLQEPAASDDVLKIGDLVRIKEGIRGPNRHLRKCCGREGTIEAIDGGVVSVRLGPGRNGLAMDLALGDVEKLSAATQAAPAAKQKPADAKPAARAKPTPAWPFPTGSRPAGVEKNSGRASPAERKSGKSKKVTNEKTVAA